MKQITLTNIMANSGKGWFSASALGNCTWQSSSQTPGDGATNSVRVIPSGAGECTIASDNKSLVASHKYYLSFKVKFESQTTATFDWYWPIAEPSCVAGLTASGDANTWIRLSAVFERTSFTNGSYPCRWDYNNDSGNNVPVRFTSCMLFDLTTAFGAGNEPNKAWMDENVTSFGDSITVQYTNIIWTPPEGWEEKSGAHVSFKSPCDCSSAGNLRIGSNVYSIVDACGNVLTGKSGAFVSGAVLDLVLDCENLKAYLQNSAASSIGVSKIQYGTVNASYSESGTTATVTFPAAFSTKPIVICQQVFNSINCIIEPENVSTTSFTIVIPALTSSGTRDIMWIALGS